MAEDALIVIDMQNDFCPGGALAVAGGDEIVPIVNRLIEGARHVILTQDWHPAGHSSFASSHPGKAPFQTVTMPYGEQTLWLDHCVQGSPGADFHPALRWTTAELVIRKGFRTRDRQLFRLLRERSPDPDRPRRLPARTRNIQSVALRPGDRFLRRLLGARCGR
ncbi:nicotinamidase-related amidase [Sinorhizobium fredii]